MAATTHPIGPAQKQHPIMINQNAVENVSVLLVQYAIVFWFL